MQWCPPFFFFSSRRRHTRSFGDWSSDVCSSDLPPHATRAHAPRRGARPVPPRVQRPLRRHARADPAGAARPAPRADEPRCRDRRARRRLGALARGAAGPLGPGRAHGGALRPPHRAGGCSGRRARARGDRLMLHARNGRTDSLEVTGRVVAPAQGIDEGLGCGIVGGVIAAIAPAEASPLVVAPAFVDPHVHLRTPGREDEETIASGTAAAAAGGYCAVVAMPNTDPVVDSSAVLEALAGR